VHELGRANFVVDGQHRVALARERGAEYVDAEVTRLVTNYAQSHPLQTHRVDRAE
jgi:hypothetical protein